jgi:hypothetical protein
MSSAKELFDRWEKVWHHGRFDLVPDCVCHHYIRHDEKGDRVVTRDDYAAELKQLREDRPGIRVLVFDHAFEGDRAWYRFMFTWPDAATGKLQTRAGLQMYRLEDGRLAETWVSVEPLGSTWPDEEAQETWTSPPPGRTAR